MREDLLHLDLVVFLCHVDIFWHHKKGIIHLRFLEHVCFIYVLFLHVVQNAKNILTKMSPYLKVFSGIFFNSAHIINLQSGATEFILK